MAANSFAFYFRDLPRDKALSVFCESHIKNPRLLWRGGRVVPAVSRLHINHVEILFVAPMDYDRDPIA